MFKEKLQIVLSKIFDRLDTEKKSLGNHYETIAKPLKKELNPVPEPEKIDPESFVKKIKEILKYEAHE